MIKSWFISASRALNLRPIASLIAASGLLLVVVCAYLPGLHGDFVFDDLPNLLENTNLQIHDLKPKTLWQASMSSDSGTLHRPVSMFTFALNYYFSGYQPFAYKVTNLCIHLATGLATFSFIYLFLSALRQTDRTQLTRDSIIVLSAITAGIWLVLPINLTSVLYIVQRMNSLAALFTVLALCAYLKARIGMFSRSHSWTIWIGTSISFSLLAVLSKENGALVPLYFLLIELAIFRWSDSTGKIDSRAVAIHIVLVALPLAIAAIYLLSHPEFILRGYEARNFALPERILTESRVLFFYIRMIFAPTVSQLGLYHDDFNISHNLLSPPSTIAAIAFLTFLLSSAVLLSRKAPVVSFGILFFFAGHVLESTVFPLELMYEHRNYLPSAGLIFAAATGIQALANRLHYPRYAVLAAVLAFATYAGTTFVRAQQWQDGPTHAMMEATNHPNSARATYMAGRLYANLYLAGYRDSSREALSWLQKAAELDRSSIVPLTAQVMFAIKTQTPADQRLLTQMRDRLTNQPIASSSISALKSLIYDGAVIRTLSTSAATSIIEAALHNPYATLRNKADLYTIYATYAANGLGDYKRALGYFIEARNNAPNEIQYHLNLIRFLIAIGEYDDAEDAWQRARQSDSFQRAAKSLADLGRQLSAMKSPIN